MKLSDLSNRPMIALELIQDRRSFNYVFSFESHQFWLTEIYSHIFGYELELFKSTVSRLMTLLSQARRHFALSWDAVIQNCIMKNPDLRQSLSEKVFLFLCFVRHRPEFNNRRYYFCGFLRGWQPLNPDVRDILVQAFIPYMCDTFTAGNNTTYRAMIDYLPFNLLRGSDAKPISLLRLAKDVIRKEIGKRYSIPENIPSIYLHLRKTLPKKVACFVLHVPDPKWLGDWEAD